MAVNTLYYYKNVMGKMRVFIIKKYKNLEKDRFFLENATL